MSGFGCFVLGGQVKEYTKSSLGLQSMDRQLRTRHPSNSGPQSIVVELKGPRSLQPIRAVVGLSYPCVPLPKALSDNGDAFDKRRQALCHGAREASYTTSILNPALKEMH